MSSKVKLMLLRCSLAHTIFPLSQSLPDLFQFKSTSLSLSLKLNIHLSLISKSDAQKSKSDKQHHIYSHIPMLSASLSSLIKANTHRHAISNFFVPSQTFTKSVDLQNSLIYFLQSEFLLTIQLSPSSVRARLFSSLHRNS